MQSVVTIDTDIYTNNKKRPSAKLQEKIKNETVNEVIEIGKFGHFIREEMTKAGLSRQTMAQYLTAELKALPSDEPGMKPRTVKNIIPNSTSSTSKSIEFEVNIATNQDKRKIAIPAQYREQVDKHFVGKKVKVRIGLL